MSTVYGMLVAVMFFILGGMAGVIIISLCYVSSGADDMQGKMIRREEQQ